MEIKLNFFERILMKLGYLLSDAGRKIRESVYKKYDKDLHYRNRGYNPKKGILFFALFTAPIMRKLYYEGGIYYEESI